MVCLSDAYGDKVAQQIKIIAADVRSIDGDDLEAKQSKIQDKVTTLQPLLEQDSALSIEQRKSTLETSLKQCVLEWVVSTRSTNIQS